MSIFQKSVINKYLKNLDLEKVNSVYDKFQTFYGDKVRLHNIMQLKEENYQEGFLREIFVQVLGYTINPDKDYNLTTEFKNQKDSRKAAGAILKDGNAVGVIELKSTKTKDLESIKEQAFGYKVNQPDCKYVITSNFQNIRLYIDNATEYEEFNLFDLSIDRFKILYLLLNKESIFNNLPDKLKQETKFHDQQITEKLYRDYQAFKDRIFDHLVKRNPQFDKLTLFKKAQKLLDRFLFILFAEDIGLILPNAISKIIGQWKMFVENDEQVSLYSRFQKFFTYLDKGHVHQQWGEIPAYNGGLFRYDEILDNPALVLPDGLLQNHASLLSAYDFGSEVDVNILGHIFEHSLSEIEEITAELQGETADKSKSKRKKDGIFYTPKYITEYIVENTVGALCNEKKAELQIKGLLIDDSCYLKNGKLNQKGKDLFKTLQSYKSWLLTLKILDPACGSGAFLNQTLDFLIAEHRQTDNVINELTGESTRYFDTDKSILENNIFGVDINEESVELAKLSLWLRTAQRGRVLSDLSGNIKCGNSLIGNPDVAGDKAFDWNIEFKEIMDKGGFDVVLGNPPYLVIKGGRWVNGFQYNNDAIDCLKKTYQTASQQINTYILFIELGSKLTKRDGIISQITPNTFLANEYCQKLREYLIGECRVIELFNAGIVFEDASVETVIMTYKNADQKPCETIVKFSILENGFVLNLKEIVNLTEDKKILINITNKTFPLLKKLNENKKISSVAKVWRGLTTGNDKKYISDTKISETYKPLLTGSEIGRYGFLKAMKYVNYIPEELDRCRDERIFLLQQKLVSKFVGNRLTFSIDNEQHYVVNTACAIEINDKDTHACFLLAILNSSLLNFYFKQIFSDTRQIFPIMKSGNIENLPFVKTNKDQQQPFIEKADLMLSLNKELQTEKQNFINTLQEEKHLKKISQAIESFYELDFEGLKKEIGKQKARFVLGKETNEWREYFNKTKQKVNELQARINQTDKKIDSMVYGLYELTDEEISVVVNSLKS